MRVRSFNVVSRGREILESFVDGLELPEGDRTPIFVVDLMVTRQLGYYHSVSVRVCVCVSLSGVAFTCCNPPSTCQLQQVA